MCESFEEHLLKIHIPLTETIHIIRYCKSTESSKNKFLSSGDDCLFCWLKTSQ